MQQSIGSFKVRLKRTIATRMARKLTHGQIFNKILLRTARIETNQHTAFHPLCTPGYSYTKMSLVCCYTLHLGDSHGFRPCIHQYL